MANFYAKYPTVGGGSGTVTSVGLAAPSFLVVSGSPVTTTGTLTLTLAVEPANTVFAGPASGADAQPTFRSLVVADIPALPYSPSALTSAHIFVGNVSNVATDVALSGDATLANSGALTLNTVNASPTTSGSASHSTILTVNGKGLVTAATDVAIQIAESQVTNLVSDLAAKQSTALTNTHILVGNVSGVAADVALSGDATLANTGALTLATVNSNVGSFTSANITVNAKGLITAAANGAAALSPTLTNTHIFVGNASNVATDVALSGDAAISNTGALSIAANAVTNAKLAQMATLTIKGNNTAGTANALDLTVAQVNAILPVFTSTLNGLAPLSGGGTTNFLRADGTWAVPAGSGFNYLSTNTSTYGGTNSTLTFTGARNVVIGILAGNALTSGTDSTYIGNSAGKAASTVNFNTAIGSQALLLGTGANNTAIGAESLIAATTAAFNTAVGESALESQTSGGRNVGIGYAAGAVCQTGTDNVSVGMNTVTSANNTTNAVIIGNASSGATGAVTVGTGNTNAFASIALGATTTAGSSGGTATTTAAGQLSIGSPLVTIQTMYLGKGATGAATALDVSIQPSPIVTGTSNTAGANTLIRGGISTGTGAGGQVQLQTVAAGSTGTAQNTSYVTGAFLDTGANFNTNKSLIMNGTTSGALTITPAASTTSYSVIMPSAQGAASALLQNDGSGNLSWASAVVGSAIMSNWSTSNAMVPSASFGTIGASQIFSRRVGDSLQVRGSFTAGTTTASIGFFTLPTGLVLDTTRLGSTTAVQPLGLAYDLAPSGSILLWSNNLAYVVFYDGSTNNQVFFTPQSASGAFAKFNANALVGTGGTFSFEMTLPISGWAANGLTNSVPVANGRYFSSTTTITGSLATVKYATLGFDAQGAYDPSTGVLTIQTPGKYQVNAAIATAGTIALNSALDIQIQQTGSSSQISEGLTDGAAGLTNLSGSVSDIFTCIAGDTLKVQVSSGATTPTIVASNSRNYFSWAWVGN